MPRLKITCFSSSNSAFLLHFACISEEKETIFPSNTNQAVYVTNTTFILFDIWTCHQETTLLGRLAPCFQCMRMFAGQRVITDVVVSQSLTTHHLICIKHYSKLTL